MESAAKDTWDLYAESNVLMELKYHNAISYSTILEIDQAKQLMDVQEFLCTSTTFITGSTVEEHLQHLGQVL